MKNYKKLRILCISAHPDDEIGGCGGYLLNCKKEKAIIKLVLLTNGEDNGNLKEKGKQREGEYKRMANLLGAEVSLLNFKRYFSLDFEKTILPLVQEIRKFRPTCILVPWEGERHPEHKEAFAITLEAIRLARKNKYLFLGKPVKVEELREYELDVTFDSFNILEDISKVINEKEKLFSVYRSQLKNKNYLAAFKGLNQYRGITYRKGTYAEAFRVRYVM